MSDYEYDYDRDDAFDMAALEREAQREEDLEFSQPEQGVELEEGNIHTEAPTITDIPELSSETSTHFSSPRSSGATRAAAADEEIQQAP